MKLLLIGHTGSVGSALLRQCVLNQAITGLVVLSRRPLSAVAGDFDSKVKVIVVDNFTVYGGEVLQELEGAIGCIWYLFLLKRGRKSLDEADASCSGAWGEKSTKTMEIRERLALTALSPPPVRSPHISLLCQNPLGRHLFVSSV